MATDGLLSVLLVRACYDRSAYHYHLVLPSFSVGSCILDFVAGTKNCSNSEAPHCIVTSVTEQICRVIIRSTHEVRRWIYTVDLVQGTLGASGRGKDRTVMMYKGEKEITSYDIHYSIQVCHSFKLTLTANMA
jgi:hypothetical protein